MSAKDNADSSLPNINCNGPQPVDQGENLVALIKQLIKEREYDGVALLFTSASEASKNLTCLPKIAMNLYHDVCLEYLNQDIFDKDASLFSCAEELLKTLAAYAPAEELLLELLELIEDAKSEQVFTSALRALQVVLLRQGNLKPRALEWSLNSIIQRRDGLNVPSYLEEGYDDEQQALLEQDEETQNLLMFYITLGLFYDPLIENICNQPDQREKGQIFRSCVIDRRNVMCCFLMELLGNPLALLDLSCSETKKTNTYTLQCAHSLTQGITNCIGDPLYLLSLVETKVLWKPRLNELKGVHQRSICNIFLIDDKLPMTCMGIYYYMVIVEEVEASKIPKVYHPLYVFEKVLYLAQELLITNHPPLHDKALKLVNKLLSNLRVRCWNIPTADLDLKIHRTFCSTLCKLIAFSAFVNLRQLGVNTLKQYILAFDDEGKYLILKNLMKSVEHQGICGYLATMYKDLVAEALTSNSTPLPKSFSGTNFQSIFLQSICKLKQGVETDLIDNADQIISSLNAVRYFAIKDAKNRTGFWSFIAELEDQFLEPLRAALNLSEAHYKAELHNVRGGRDMASMQDLNILDLQVPNDRLGEGFDLQLDRDKKIELLNQNLCTFDLIRSILGRVCEFLNQLSPGNKAQGANEINGTSASLLGSIQSQQS